MSELARAILADNESPPVLVLAAWHYLYGWKRDWIPALAAEAASGRDGRTGA